MVKLLQWHDTFPIFELSLFYQLFITGLTLGIYTGMKNQAPVFI